MGALVVGLGARLFLAFTDDGIYWPDEIHQSLEPAHRLVFGYGLIAWEFIQGARSWAFPGVVALVLKACALVGLDAPAHYLGAVRILLCGLSAATGYGVYRLARGLGATQLASAVGAALFLLPAVPIYFAHRAMSETASAPLVVFGVWLLLAKEPGRWRLALGASLLGLSVLFRLQNALFPAVALAVVAFRPTTSRRLSFNREALVALGVLAGWALVFGALDRITWGSWFHSARVYLKFNLIEGQAARWGTAPFGYYGRVLWQSMPTAFVWLWGLSLLGLRRAPGLGLIAFSFLLAHSAVPHKELRFIFPALPLVAALTAVGFDALPKALPRRAAAAALLACVAFSGARLRALTFGQLGQYEQEKPGQSALDDFGPLNRLLLIAHRQPDLCGLKVEVVHLAWSGGATYLHRNVPIYQPFGPGRESGLFNYVATAQGYVPPGGVTIAQEGPFVLARLPTAGCRPDPGYQWDLR